MKTNTISEAIARRKKYDRIRKDEKCFRGDYKWPGMAFCRQCMNRLPPGYRTTMFTASPISWPDAYDSAKSYLEEGERQHG